MSFLIRILIALLLQERANAEEAGVGPCPAANRVDRSDVDMLDMVCVELMYT